MFPVLKIAGLAAILSAGFVAISEAPVRAAAPLAAKIFYDRATDAAGSVQQVRYADAASAARAAPVVNRSAKGDATPAATQADCSMQAWPYKSAECLAVPEGAPARKPVRTIAISVAR